MTNELTTISLEQLSGATGGRDYGQRRLDNKWILDQHARTGSAYGTPSAIDCALKIRKQSVESQLRACGGIAPENKS